MTSREPAPAQRPPAGLAFLPVLGSDEPPLPERPPLPVQTSHLITAADRIGGWKARWGIGRMNYRVQPGLYALGNPDKDSPVLVSANYKLSFDVLRSSLPGRNGWILVLDTDGINVWCAAGKGTFGTKELVKQVRLAVLEKVVSHRRLIVPQLGAVGVAGHEVRKATGFRVIFGPVRAADLPAFLDAGLNADRIMRTITFTVGERFVLVPMELMPAVRMSIPFLLLLFLLGGLGTWGWTLDAALRNGRGLLGAYGGAVLAGAVLTPILLPWIPGRAFSVKGALAGLAWALILLFALPSSPSAAPPPVWESLACLTALPAVAAFFAMNFTGSTAITSQSGVKKEMRFALPLQIAGAAAGVAFWVASHFSRTGVY